MQVSKVWSFFVCLSQADGDGGAARGLDEILGTAFFKPFYKVDRFGEVNDRCVGSCRAEATGEPFPNGNF